MPLPKTIYVFTEDDAFHEVSHNEPREDRFFVNRPRLGTDQSRSLTRHLAASIHASPESQKSSSSLEVTASLLVPQMLHFDEHMDQLTPCVALKTHRRSKAVFIG